MNCSSECERAMPCKCYFALFDCRSSLVQSMACFIVCAENRETRINCLSFYLKRDGEVNQSERGFTFYVFWKWEQKGMRTQKRVVRKYSNYQRTVWAEISHVLYVKHTEDGGRKKREIRREDDHSVYSKLREGPPKAWKELQERGGRREKKEKASTIGVKRKTDVKEADCLTCFTREDEQPRTNERTAHRLARRDGNKNSVERVTPGDVIERRFGRRWTCNEAKSCLLQRRDHRSSSSCYSSGYELAWKERGENKGSSEREEWKRVA